MPDGKKAVKATHKHASSARSNTSRREERRLHVEDLSRAHLLDAAEEVFGSKGFHKATIKEVADLAEFSIGSVYSLFDNKDDLFRQVFIRRGDEFMPGMRTVLGEEGTPRERLHRLVDYQVRFFREHPHFGRVYLRSSTPTMSMPEDLTDPIVAERYADTLQMQADLFAQGQRSGEFGPGDPSALARLLAGLVSAYVALDPAVESADPDAPELLPLSRFHELVERAFSP